MTNVLSIEGGHTNGKVQRILSAYVQSDIQSTSFATVIMTPHHSWPRGQGLESQLGSTCSVGTLPSSLSEGGAAVCFQSLMTGFSSAGSDWIADVLAVPLRMTTGVDFRFAPLVACWASRG